MVPYGFDSLSPFNLYGEAGAIAHCLSNAEAVTYFEKALTLRKDVEILTVLRCLYEAEGRADKLADLTRDMISALNLRKTEIQRELELPGIPGKAQVDAWREIEGLNARIEEERLYLATLMSKRRGIEG